MHLHLPKKCNHLFLKSEWHHAQSKTLARFCTGQGNVQLFTGDFLDLSTLLYRRIFHAILCNLQGSPMPMKCKMKNNAKTPFKLLVQSGLQTGPKLLNDTDVRTDIDVRTNQNARTYFCNVTAFGPADSFSCAASSCLIVLGFPKLLDQKSL